MSPKKKTHAVVIVAHPDDEAIFFGGLLLSKKHQWTVVCVTDGNADGKGKSRQKHFEKSCRLFGVKNILCLGFKDTFKKRLNQSELQEAFELLGNFDAVFTHGPLGEYGHPHHQDISFAAHKTWNKLATVYSVSQNVFPDLTVSLSPGQYKKKCEILWKVYGGELKRFLNFVPSTWTEGFSKVSLGEVESIFNYYSKGKALKTQSLKKYRWMLDYMKKRKDLFQRRPF